MDIAFASAVSGLQANAVRFATAAYNVANVNTDGFKARQADTVSQAAGGVSTRVSETQNPVDLATQFVSMIESQNAYDANALVVSRLGRMTGQLLNIKA